MFADYKKDINNDAASPGLNNAELQTLAHGDRILHDFAFFVTKYNATHENKIKFVYLHPENTAKDTRVKDIKAEEKFSRKISILDAPVGGRYQAHDDPVLNAAAYNAAISKAIATLG